MKYAFSILGIINLVLICFGIFSLEKGLSFDDINIIAMGIGIIVLNLAVLLLCVQNLRIIHEY